MSRIPRPPSTAQKLALFREECRAYYAWKRDPEKRKPRVEPDPAVFQNGLGRAYAHTIKSEELARHEKILKERV